MSKYRGNLRWWICVLLFAATTINYMDRQILGILAPALQKEIGWSESGYGLIVTAFQTAYALGLLISGPVLETLRMRAGYALAVGLWSAAAALHGLMRSAVGFGAARFLLGLGEAGNFPAAIKIVTEWFPQKERALAIGVFNCGSNVGAILTPLAVPWMAVRFGWRYAFLITGAAGFVWMAAWLGLYHEPGKHPRLRRSELEYIRSGRVSEPAALPWKRLLRFRAVWALIAARFLTDPVWWFYLFWVPKFLHGRYGIGLADVGLPLVAIYLAANAGSVFGGWFSSALIRRGCTVNVARKLAILVCALMVTPMTLGWRVTSVWQAVAIISLAAAGHQGWAANMFASISDLFPSRAVSSVVGISGFGGAVGGMLAATAIGFILEKTGSYVPVFAWAGVSYLIVLGLIHAMIRDIKPLEI
jgi:ACS family hexuronate transporter-like MFS transporter